MGGKRKAHRDIVQRCNLPGHALRKSNERNSQNRAVKQGFGGRVFLQRLVEFAEAGVGVYEVPTLHPSYEINHL